MIIGITGKSGCGKNYIAESLCRLNPSLVHIDIDTVGHRSFDIPEVREKLIHHFGEDILSDGKINRKAVADLVFTNRHNYSVMAEATWGHMQRMIDESISDTSKDYILNWILLPHSRYFGMCDTKILVKRDDSIRVAGVLERDGITREKLAERDSAGIGYTESDFDFVIVNNGVK